MLLLTVCCIISGFYTGGVKKTMFKPIAIAYCWLLTVLCLTNWIFYTITVLPKIQYDFINIMYTLLEIVRVIMITYYRVRYLTGGDLISDIIRNIDYADNCLEHMCADVFHRGDQMECVAYTGVTLFTFVTFAFFAFQQKSTHGDSEMPSEFYSVHHKITDFAMIYSVFILSTQFTFLLHRVKKRMVRLRRAVEESEIRSGRRLAWTCEKTAVIQITGIENAVMERLNYLNKVKQVDRCLYDAFCSIKIFYSNFFCLQVILFVLGCSIILSFCAFNKKFLYLVCILAWFTSVQNFSVALCMFIQSEFQTIQAVVNKEYWTINEKYFAMILRNMSKWQLRCVCMDRRFDCGYFKINIKLLPLLLDFVSLFIFTIVSLYK